MTIPTDLASRVAALATLPAAARRIEILSVLRDMTSAGLPVRTSTVKLWQELASQLDLCGVELRCEDSDRNVMFFDHASRAYQIANALIEQIVARSPGMTVHLPRGWQPAGLVVDAVSAEAA